MNSIIKNSLIKYYIFILLISCLPLIHIFITPGIPHTSDGEMHLIRSAVYYKELTQGQIPVRWASQFHYGYGTAIFNFVYPLPYIINIPLIVFGIALEPILKIDFFISYILAGIFMFVLAKKLFKDRLIALFIAVMYQFAPFRLVEMLIRGSLGSLYAYTLLPLSCYAILRFLEKKDSRSFVLISISISLLSLSHTIIGFAFIGIAVMFLFYRTQNINNTIKTMLAIFIGLGISSFFIIPAIIEQKYTNGFLFSKNVFYDHFPPLIALFVPNLANWQTLRVAEIPVQIGFFHVLALLTTFFAAIFHKNIKQKVLAIFLMLLSITTLLFMLPISKILWENINFIRQFQYPWRFLSIIVFTSSLSSVFFIRFLQKHTNNKIIYTVIILVIISTLYYWKPPNGYSHQTDNYYRTYPKTTNYFSEVNTIWMGKEPASFPKKRIEIVSGQAKIQNQKISSIKHSFTINASGPAMIVDKTYFFPGWKLLINGKYNQIQFQDTNYQGLVTFNVDKGIHNIIIQYEQSKIQKLGNLISIISVIIIITLLLNNKYINKLFKIKN